MRSVLKHDLVLDRPFSRRVNQIYLGTHFMFRETTLMLLSIAGAVMRTPITFQTPAPPSTMASWWSGHGCFFYRVAFSQMCTALASDTDVVSFKLL